ncbi:hypothetical protein SORBI_3001G290832 [Sorghum bicolor]|uniref:Uncharacterized protein n=1 Tax=Sorghum bicolor TaxID=4558 RepID=A0A1Z5S8P5_SORBI|nr:hypothetical protein SORBI_3001G290832 [Sorghum bicolor]
MTWAKALPMPMWSSSSCLADDDYVATSFTSLEASSMSSCVLVIVVVRLSFLLFFFSLSFGCWHFSPLCLGVCRCKQMCNFIRPFWATIYKKNSGGERPPPPVDLQKKFHLFKECY